VRVMHDGINTDAASIAKIIKPGDLVAYYIDGRYAWTPEERAMFPNNEHITITVLGNPADVADCETGDLTPEEAAAWIERQRARGYFRPSVYRSLSLMQDIRNATGPLIMGKDWDSWVADYDDSTSNVYPGAAAKQYRNESIQDLSEVYDDGWPHRSAPTTPVPVSVQHPKWPGGVTLQFNNRGNAVEALQQSLANSGIYGVRGIDVDGVFGQQTQTAVRNFQAEVRIQVDGIAGAETRASLISHGLMNAVGEAID
jgi:Putative peptidoglycan binding domain